jgi:poly(hydroxyalkanoate) depolymerase family esterase
MNDIFNRLLVRATALTRSGRLREATAAIQDALRTRARPQPAPAGQGDVIDIEVLDVTTPDGAPRAAAPASAGEFMAHRYAGSHGGRDYRLFVPPRAGDLARPLVLMLHGCTQDPQDFARGTGMNEAASALGVLVAYPEQTRGANSSGCWNWFKHNHQRRGKGEPALLAGLVQAVMASHAVDPSRVYVAGLSAGGAMAAILGDAYPELFAAVGVHSGLPTGSARDVQSAFAAMHGGAAATSEATRAGPPTIVFHGDGDTTVHPVNGERVAAACISGAAVQSEQGRSPGGRAWTRHIHRDGTGRVRAEHWAVHGAGHAWSGGSAQGSFTDPQGPDATAEMLRFFLANPRAAAG